MTMLLHVDLAFIASTARLRAPFVPLGVVPEAAGSLLMPIVMGNQRAALKLYTGDWITADEAVEYGLALRAVEPDALMNETMDLARRIAKMPVASLSATKRVVVEGRIDAVRAAGARRPRVHGHDRPAREHGGDHRLLGEAGARLLAPVAPVLCSDSLRP